MTSPWNRNEGKYGRPSSSVPVQPLRKASFVERRVAEAKRDGVVAVGADTILQRIDDAIGRCREAGMGNPKAIYLTELDLVAFMEAHGTPEYRDVRVSDGASSKVYARGGASQVIRKRPSPNVKGQGA